MKTELPVSEPTPRATKNAIILWYVRRLTSGMIPTPMTGSRPRRMIVITPTTHTERCDDTTTEAVMFDTTESLPETFAPNENTVIVADGTAICGPLCSLITAIETIHAHTDYFAQCVETIGSNNNNSPLSV